MRPCLRCGTLIATGARCECTRRKGYRTKAYQTARARLLAMGLPCVHCGARATEADHIIPRAHGGQDTLGNLQPSCKPCNSARKADW